MLLTYQIETAGSQYIHIRSLYLHRFSAWHFILKVTLLTYWIVDLYIICNVMSQQHILVVTSYLFQFHMNCNKCPHVKVKCANQETDQAYAMVALGV